MQTPLAPQHPFGHDFALQTQAPLTHAFPAGQAGPLPQRQVPVSTSQLLATRAVHVAHATPPMPHVAKAGTVQTLLTQQPLGHAFALHTQAPATQFVPAPQDAPAPQRHAPVAEQLSERDISHVTQAAAPVPHVASDPIVHVEPEQHPLGQLAGLQLLQTPPPQGPSPQF